MLLTIAFFISGLLSSTAFAIVDEHSVEGVREAIQSSIPESAVEKARALDDQLLRTGTAMGTKVYLVTDNRQQQVERLVFSVLTAIGESPQGWVVRVLDTDPKIVNAFVNGGKYIYVFTGLLQQVQSANELAVVVEHEIGHSMLKHNIRRSQDLTTTFANLAAIYGQIKGGVGGSNAMAMSRALHNGYSRDDEREADAFGAIAAWRAGFDPLGGAGFFSRLERAADASAAVESKSLEEYKAKALNIKAQCETWRAQWANGQAAHTQQNAGLINQTCSQYVQAANAYNAAIAQEQTARLQQTNSDHPADQERVAAIAAITDWLHGVRPLQSLQGYPRAYCVIAALMQTNSAIFERQSQQTTHQENASAMSTRPVPESHADASREGATLSVGSDESAAFDERHPPDSPFIKQWNALEDALASGVITKAEYDQKFAALMAKHKTEQDAAN